MGFIQCYDDNPSPYYPAFLPASANVPNNIGVQFYDDPTHTVLSDQIWVQSKFWYFASAPDLIDFAANGITSVAALTEDGTLQDVSSFFQLPPTSMEFQDQVPEPATCAILGLGAYMLAGLRRRR